MYLPLICTGAVIDQLIDPLLRLRAYSLFLALLPHGVQLFKLYLRCFLAVCNGFGIVFTQGCIVHPQHLCKTLVRRPCLSYRLFILLAHGLPAHHVNQIDVRAVQLIGKPLLFGELLSIFACGVSCYRCAADDFPVMFNLIRPVFLTAGIIIAHGGSQLRIRRT